MNKTELIETVAQSAGLKKVESEKAVNAVIEAIEKALADGEKVQLVGFGTFDVKERQARKGRNPRNGETIMIAASKSVTFAASTSLKTKVNK